MNDDDPPIDPEITKLPVRFKEPLPEERSILLAWEAGKGGGCTHLFAQYLVSDTDAEVECGRCGTKLNPIWVLVKLAVHDRRMAESQQRYQEEQKRLAERTRTKCQHCGEMTRISRR